MTGIVAYILAKKIALGAVSGIAGITLNGNQLVFQFKDGSSASMTIPLPKDGQDGVPGIDGKDGQDGLSIVKVEIDANNHLICTMSDNSTIDAGELPDSSGGGLIQVKDKASLPAVGENDTLYLTKDDNSLYYWDNEYKSIKGTATIDNIGLADKEDIDKLFDNLPDVDISNPTLATTEDIDNLFGNLSDIDTSEDVYAKEEDINNLFGNMNDVDTSKDIYAKEEDIDSLFGGTESNPVLPENSSLATKQDIDNLFS